MNIVVARYNEDITWVYPYMGKEDVNVIVYNKGTPLHCPNEICLENVGREGHTFYKYIYDNYDNLHPYTIFLQGNPFDHSPNIIENINNLIKDKKYINDFMFLSENIIHCNLTGCYNHYGIPLKDVYEKIFGERKEEMGFTFGAGAQFVVSKKQILQRPKEFYLKIIDLLKYDISPIEGYVIERFHQLIFTPMKI